MFDTDLIDEVREIRRRIAEECGNDLQQIAQRAAEAARRFQELSMRGRAQECAGTHGHWAS